MSDPKRVVKLAKQFQETIDLAKELDEIGNLEQAKRNAEAATVVAQGENTQVRVQLASNKEALRGIEDELKLTQKQAEDMIFLAKQTAQEIITEAKGEAKVIVRKALESERTLADRILRDQRGSKRRAPTLDGSLLGSFEMLRLHDSISILAKLLQHLLSNQVFRSTDMRIDK